MNFRQCMRELLLMSYLRPSTLPKSWDMTTMPLVLPAALARPLVQAIKEAALAHVTLKSYLPFLLYKNSSLSSEGVLRFVL